MTSPTGLTRFSIRRGEVDDAAALAEFAARTFEDAFGANNRPDDIQAHNAATYGPDTQAAELADPSIVTILAHSGTKLIAYAQVRRSRPPPCVTHESPIELHRLYVDRPAHGSGLASRLMQAIRDAATELQARHIWLGVWEQNPRAIAFYNKEGFVDVGSTYFMVGGDRQTDRVLVVSVAPPELGAISDSD